MPLKKLLPYLHQGLIEAGCDEAGRGCLAGPVVAAAVILPPEFSLDGIDDSKKLSKSKRNFLRGEIERLAISWSVFMIDPEEIDRINILRASMKAMQEALSGLNQDPQHILIDGNRFPGFKKIPHSCIIKGDGKYASIAAASILAKTYRDDFMEKIHLEFPHYGWDKNAGYPTAFHRNAIRKHGPCKHHRMSFRLLPEQLSLEF
jgi:ribonuclease HII